jgi:hypothetical protein
MGLPNSLVANPYLTRLAVMAAILRSVNTEDSIPGVKFGFMTGGNAESAGDVHG